jgi:hypothetical protein
MQGQASFGQSGAPTSSARSTQATPTADYRFVPEDFDLDDFTPEDNAPKPLPPEDEGAFKPLHWAILVALALIGFVGVGVIVLATAEQPAPPAAQVAAGSIPASQTAKSAADDRR